MVGTWIVEDRKAVDMGYGLVDVFEFWVYEITCFDKDKLRSFAEYVNMLIKLKQELSGHSSWVQIEENKDKYIEDYRHVEGIALDKASISKFQGNVLWQS